MLGLTEYFRKIWGARMARNSRHWLFLRFRGTSGVINCQHKNELKCKNFCILHKILKIQKRKKPRVHLIFCPKQLSIDKRGPDADQYSHACQDSRAYRSVRNQKPRCKFAAPILKVGCYQLKPKTLGHKKSQKRKPKVKTLIKNQATESTPNLFIYFYSFLLRGKYATALNS